VPIDPAEALNAEVPLDPYRWTADDVILYHLGLGAGWSAPIDPAELTYVYETDLKVLCTFGVIPAFDAVARLNEVPGCEIDMLRLLHGEQDLRIHAPIPTEGSVDTVARIAEIWDKGSAALVVVETESRLARTLLVTNRFSLFCRGEGGFGGERGPSNDIEPPSRMPDAVIESPTLPHQALLYRLSGDKNPLHGDPAVARTAGFDRPILHGLSTYGVVAKAITDRLFEGDAGAIASYRARFVGVVFPGETIVTSVWDDGDTIIATATTAERGQPVLHGEVHRR
jgi:acyl dehydratase